MAQASQKSLSPKSVSSVKNVITRPFFVGAGSLAIAGLLGACASPSTAPVAAGPSPAGAAQAPGGIAGMPVIVTLKNAETAIADYARARHRETELRETVQLASDAALVARHRQVIGVPDYLFASDAEGRLAAARRELRLGEMQTRVARARLYRALGMAGNNAVQVEVRAPAEGAGPRPTVAPEEAPHFESSTSL